jgi:hypothetical protein
LHKGTLLAALLVGGLIIGVAVWAVLAPYLSETDSAVLRNALTGQIVVCRASVIPNFIASNSASRGVAVCSEVCQTHGFSVVSGDQLVIDWASLKARQQAEERWRNIIPAACRSKEA